MSATIGIREGSMESGARKRAPVCIKMVYQLNINRLLNKLFASCEGFVQRAPILKLCEDRRLEFLKNLS